MQKGKNGTIATFKINDPHTCCTHSIKVFEFTDHYQVYGEAPCSCPECREGTHEIVFIKDTSMNEHQAYYPIVFHGIRLGAYEDDAGRIKYSYYDFRHRVVLLDLPRVLDGHVTFEW